MIGKGGADIVHHRFRRVAKIDAGHFGAEMRRDGADMEIVSA